ncbi:MAG: HAMP domain-containing histidine kinase [Cyclobacteriaceae bacterium]|nr:HAMP domain-containing histidine kinase [Cyclobacteriaceae bacterium]
MLLKDVIGKELLSVTSLEGLNKKMLFIFTGLALLATFVFGFIFYHSGLTILFYHTLFASLVFGGLYLVTIRVTTSVIAIFRLVIGMIYYSLVFEICLTGGIHSSAIPLLLFVPLNSILYQGKKDLIVLNVLVGLTVFVLWLLDIYGVDLTSQLSTEDQPVFDLANYILLMSVVLMLVYFFKNQMILAHMRLENAYDDLREKSRMLVESEKMASLGQLTAGIAHEINNPVNFIQLGITNLSKAMEDFMKFQQENDNCIRDVEHVSHTLRGEELHAYVNDRIELLKKCREDIGFDTLKEEVHTLMESIMHGSDRTSAIVKGLRVFSRMDQDTFEDVNLSENMNSTLMLLKSQIGEGIHVRKEYKSEIWVEGSASKLSQVFMNILVNAIHSLEGRDGEISISIDDTIQSGFTSIKISDTGRGIDPQVISKIFEPFFTTKEVGSGTGLGLSISKGIIDEHKGSISVSNNKEKGVTFTIELPKSQAKNL